MRSLALLLCCLLGACRGARYPELVVPWPGARGLAITDEGIYFGDGSFTWRMAR